MRGNEHNKLRTEQSERFTKEKVSERFNDRSIPLSKLDGLTAGATKNVTYSAPLTGSSASITLATMGMSSVDHVQTFVGDDLVLMETKVTSTGVSWASNTAFSASSNAKIVVTGR